MCLYVCMYVCSSLLFLITILPKRAALCSIVSPSALLTISLFISEFRSESVLYKGEEEFAVSL